MYTEYMTQAKIKAARLKAGLTQAQAAELLGVACITWQNWERSISPMPTMAWELFQLKTKPLKCPGCGHHLTLTQKPEKPGPRKGPRRRPMRIQIREGVVLQVLNNEAWIHCSDLESGITPADEAKARELLPSGVKLRED